VESRWGEENADKAKPTGGGGKDQGARFKGGVTTIGDKKGGFVEKNPVRKEAKGGGLKKKTHTGSCLKNLLERHQS